MLWVPKTTSTCGACSRTVVAVALADAAADRDEHVGATARLERLQRRDLTVEALVGGLAHAARVEHDHVGGLRGSRLVQAPCASSRPAMRSESCLFIWHPKVRTK